MSSAATNRRSYTPRRRATSEPPPPDPGLPSDPVEVAFDELCNAALAVTVVLAKDRSNELVAMRLRDAVAAMGMRMADERNAAIARRRERP